MSMRARWGSVPCRGVVCADMFESACPPGSLVGASYPLLGAERGLGPQLAELDHRKRGDRSRDPYEGDPTDVVMVLGNPIRVIAAPTTQPMSMIAAKRAPGTGFSRLPSSAISTP